MTPKRSVYSYIHCSQILLLREIMKDLFYIYLETICPRSCAQSPGSQSQSMNDVSIHLEDLRRATPILTPNSVAEVSCNVSAASAYSGKELLVGKLSTRKVIRNDFYTTVCVGGWWMGLCWCVVVCFLAGFLRGWSESSLPLNEQYIGAYYFPSLL